VACASVRDSSARFNDQSWNTRGKSNLPDWQCSVGWEGGRRSLEDRYASEGIPAHNRKTAPFFFLFVLFFQIHYKLSTAVVPLTEDDADVCELMKEAGKNKEIQAPLKLFQFPESCPVTKVKYRGCRLGACRYQEVTTHDIHGTYKRPWYPADIRLISSISGCCIRSKHGCFQRFLRFFFLSFFFFLLSDRSTDIWLIFRCIQQIFFNILQKSVRYSIEISSIFSWYPFIIPLTSG